MLLLHRWAEVVFVPMIKTNLSFSFGLHLPLLVCRSEIIASESCWNLIQHACIMFSYLYRISSAIFTAQIFANMFNNSTQHLAAVATSISPLSDPRDNQFSSIHLCPCSWACPAFWTKLDESTLDCVVSAECRHFGLKYTPQRAPASRYIVAFIFYSAEMVHAYKSGPHG